VRRYDKAANELLRRSQLRSELASMVPDDAGPVEAEWRKELETRVRSAKHSLRWNTRRAR